MRLLAFAAVVSSSLAFGQDAPADAPLADLPGRSVHLAPGEAAPFSGRLLSDDEHRASEAQCRHDHDELKKAETSVLLHPLVLAAIVVGVLAAGVAVGVAVDRALPR